jgi:hypothetical protein
MSSSRVARADDRALRGAARKMKGGAIPAGARSRVFIAKGSALS